MDAKIYITAQNVKFKSLEHQSVITAAVFQLMFKFHLLFLNTPGGRPGKTFCSWTATFGPLIGVPACFLTSRWR